jgi:autotransporter-associated beta strand protein
VVTLTDDIATFNGETTGGLYGIDIPSASLGVFSGRLIDSNATLAADGKTPCVNLTLGGIDAFPISDGSSPCEIVMDGTGALTLTAVNTYSGGTTVHSGTLVIQNGATSGTGPTTIGSGAREIIASGGSAGPAPITFASAAATLEIDAPATGWTFANTLENFGVGDTLDLAGMPALFDASAAYSAGVLTVTSDKTSESFNLSGTSATTFAISEDAQGGVQITGANTGSSTLTNSVTVYSESQLDDAISYLNAQTLGAYTITFGGVIGESSTPLAFNLQSDVTATLDGGGYTLDGNTGFGGLSVTSGDVTIENLTVVGTTAAVPATGKLVNVGFWNDNAVVNSGANSTFSMAGSNNSIVMLGSGGAITLSGTSLGSDAVNGLSGATGTVFLSSAQTSVDGGGDTINFASGSGNVASLWNTNGNWDAVYGSNGTIALNNAISGVIGGGDTIVFASGAGNVASLYNTNNNWDTVTGSNGVVELNSALANVSGGGDFVYFAGGTGNVAGLYDTNGTWDGVSGSDGVVELNSALATVSGGGDFVYFAGGTGNAVGLYNTNGTWDGVSGSNGVVELNSALAAVYGGSDMVYFAGGAGNAVALYNTNGTWDGVAGSNGVVELTNALASVFGGGDFIYFAGGAGNAVALYNTNGTWDGVSGSNGVVELNSALAAVYGGSDTVYFAGGAGNAVALYNTNGTWDGVAGSNGVVELTSALASVFGGGDTVYFAGGTGNAVALYNTNGNGDNVVGSNGVVELGNASAAVYGDGDTIYFNSGQNVASASGNQEAFVFQTAIGQNTVTGFEVDPILRTTVAWI